jgi:hypothetical protein
VTALEVFDAMHDLRNVTHQLWLILGSDSNPSIPYGSHVCECWNRWILASYYSWWTGDLTFAFRSRDKV